MEIFLFINRGLCFGQGLLKQLSHPAAILNSGRLSSEEAPVISVLQTVKTGK